VHATLAQTPFEASAEMVRRVAQLESQMLGLGDIEANAAAHVVQRVLGHELIARARAAEAAGACRRETPVTITTPDRTLVEGVVDLAFQAGDRWIVVDYKTDRELAAQGEDRYRRQVALYASAIARAAAMPCDAVVLVV
jgi:ATP-dependent exoDNAse (exonuclease V) beta subunit